MKPVEPMSPAFQFPADFVWGVATSAFQIEGAPDADGRTPSIWDTFCQRPGAIADGSNGRVACEHYRRWQQDVDLIASLGVNAYRFSVSWPRVMPQGQGPANAKGLDFYERLIDGLLAKGVAPHVTLNHWDLPEVLQAEGGWANRDTVHRFVDYALAFADRMGERVAAYTTHNEPWVMAQLGHETGIFAPGIRDVGVAAQVSHHLLLSHDLTLKALRASGLKSPLGIVLNLSPMHPATSSPEDLARTTLEDGRLLRWYMDPLFHGRYPQDVLDALGADVPAIRSGDLAAICQPLDFMGINYYTRAVVSAGQPFDVATSGLPLTDMNWEIYPQGLTELLLRVHRDYRVPPLYITENGGAFADQVVGGQVHDADRTRYLADHIGAVAEAMRQGVPMAGYMVWSLLDNFEWASGYAKRFGIVHVDYATQQRTPKDSALWYRGFLAEQKALAASRG